MRRIRLIVSYDGTNYCGWQIQENAVTVEGTLTDALRKWLKEDIEIIGASRTDSGVHANAIRCRRRQSLSRYCQRMC